MSNLRKVNDDILRDWMIFRDETISSLHISEDRKHLIYFDSICDSILIRNGFCNAIQLICGSID